MSNTTFEEFERIRFERWLRAQPHVLNVGYNKLNKEYVLQEDQDQWIGWLACASLRVSENSQQGEES